MILRRALFKCHNSPGYSRGASSNRSPGTKLCSVPKTDAVGIPHSPTWSVNDLIDSYPSPKLSSANLMHLHKLAALIPPKESDPEFEQLNHEMEDLVRLVEAVRIAPEVSCEEGNPFDGRVWARGRGIALDRSMAEQNALPPFGDALLEHSQRTRDGYYVVDGVKSKT